MILISLELIFMIVMLPVSIILGLAEFAVKLPIAIIFKTEFRGIFFLESYSHWCGEFKGRLRRYCERKNKA